MNVAANDLATITPAKTYTAADFPDMNNRTIDLTDLSDTGFLLVNIDAEVLTMNTPLQIMKQKIFRMRISLGILEMR